jgi:hypothetical protein
MLCVLRAFSVCSVALQSCASQHALGVGTKLKTLWTLTAPDLTQAITDTMLNETMVSAAKALGEQVCLCNHGARD